MQAEQKSEDSGHAGSRGSKSHDGSIQRTAGASCRAADKGPEVAKVDAEDGRLCDSHEAGHGRGNSHSFRLLVLCLQSNRQCRRALGDVCRRSQRQPVGLSIKTKLSYVNDGIHVVHASHHRQGIEAAHDKASDAKGQGNQLLHAVDNRVFNRYKDRSNDGKGQIPRHKDADQRRHKEVEHSRNYLMKPFFDPAHHKDSDDYRNDVPLVAHQIHVVEAEPHGKRLMDALGSHRPGILQVGMDHHHANYRAQKGISTEHLSRAERNQNRQEGIGGIGKEVGKRKERARGVQVQEAIIYHKVQGFHNSHQKTAGHNRWNNRYEDVAQGLDGPLKERLLLGGGCLGLFLAHAAHAGNCQEFIVHLIYGSGSEDNLKLPGSAEDALDAVDFLHRLHVALRVVRQNQTEAGRTVGCGDKIFPPAHFFIDLFCCLSVIHYFSPFLI